MEQEGEIPIPISSSTYGASHHGGHGHVHDLVHHHHDHDHHDHRDDRQHERPAAAPTQAVADIPSNKEVAVVEEDEDEEEEETEKSCGYKYKYRECMKNHAAAMGGNARDGCGEFIASGGEEDALICSACSCHRNFHRKELLLPIPHQYPQLDQLPHYDRHLGLNLRTSSTAAAPILPSSRSRNFVLAQQKGGAHSLGYPAARTAPVLPMIMSYSNRAGPGAVAHEHDREEKEHHHLYPHLRHLHDHAYGGSGSGSGAAVKKRFRTKFTQEQREKMLGFAERVGWKIQKQEDSVVHRFCQEIGVKRRVLKVWMHNNKHNLAKKNNPPPPTTSSS